MRSTERNFIALVIVAVLAACGGGGGSSPSAITPQSGATSASTGTGTTGTATAAPSSVPDGYAKAQFTITVPRSSSGSASRARQSIGAGTNSIVFTLLESGGTPVSGGTPQVFSLTATSPGCSSGSSGITCTLSVAAPLGLDVYLAQTYTGTNGTGTLTGSGAVQLDVAQNASNSASLSLTSQAASVYLASSASYLGAPYNDYGDGDASNHRGTAASRRPADVDNGDITSLRIFVIALDASGNTILNPSIYDTPISLQLVFLDEYQDPLFPGVPDVTLSVAYSSAVDPGGCSGNATTSTSYGSIQVCSPADVVTAAFDNVPNGSPNISVIGSVGRSGYFPVPSTTPEPFPNATPTGVSYLVFPVTTPTGAEGTLPVIGQ